jgi:hypothetical protein
MAKGVWVRSGPVDVPDGDPVDNEDYPQAHAGGASG